MTAAKRMRVAGIVALCAAAACGGDAETDAPPATTPITTSVEVTRVTFDTATLTLHAAGRTIEMPVEIAERPEQRSYGLMDRDELPENSGMVFLYDAIQHRDSGFWMYRTRIPLDIAFFDGAGKILAVRQMMPCPSTDAAQCPGYAAGVDYFGAIEANRGWFARNGIGVGDRITLPGRIGE